MSRGVESSRNPRMRSRRVFWTVVALSIGTVIGIALLLIGRSYSHALGTFYAAKHGTPALVLRELQRRPQDAGLWGQPTATELVARIQSEGAREVVSKLYFVEIPQWQAVLHEVAAGQPEWLQVALQLRSGSEYGPGNDLDKALASALVHVPRAVLAILRGPAPASGTGFQVAAVCGQFSLDDTDGVDELAWFQSQEAAAASVSDPELRAIRSRCVASIRRAADDWRRTTGQVRRRGRITTR